ncbi:unnamed protein product, partial [Ixodes hexagonus]
RVVFHQKWLCQRSKRNKTASRLCTNCRAYVDIKIKKLTRATKRNDPFLKRDVPLAAVVRLAENHNHCLDDVEDLRLLRTTPATRALFYGYFRDGLTPAKAIVLHRERLSSEDDASARLASGAINPSGRTVQHWYEVWRKRLSGELDPTAKLDEAAPSYLQRGVDIKTSRAADGSCWAVLVVTPIMRRTQQLEGAAATVFVDSTSLLTATATMTLFLAATGAGAIPLAVALHGPRSAESFVEAFGLLKRSYPLCFGGAHRRRALPLSAEAPRAFVTGDSSAERDALRSTWPEAARFLYPLDVVQAEWGWLSTAENKVGQDERRDLMSAFQKVGAII